MLDSDVPLRIGELVQASDADYERLVELRRQRECARKREARKRQTPEQRKRDSLRKQLARKRQTPEQREREQAREQRRS